MTKKQDRVRGFGKRSLSLVLAILLVLSTMVVLLTATSTSAGAGEIECWYVVGPFNNWSANESFKLTKQNGQFEGTVPPVVATSPFKLLARQDGSDHWNGLKASDTNPISLGTDTALTWETNETGSTKDIRLNGANNPQSLNFYVYVKDGGNRFSVTENQWNTSGSNHGGNTYTANASVSPGNVDSNGIFWAKATYYDYLSDWEREKTSWLKPVEAGTGFKRKNSNKWSNDEWYPFNHFNENVVKPLADAGWQTPLYFGNFCYNDGAYDTSGHHPGTTPSNHGFNDAVSRLTNFKYAVNNSNTKNYGVGGQGLNNYNQSYQGLMASSLGTGDKLLIADTNTEAPYFSDSIVTSGYANKVESAFPFRVTDNGSFKQYEFNSTGGNDNVYFNWESDGDSLKPTGVNYGGSAYAIEDGLGTFMGNQGPGYGIFPFNGGTGDRSNANDNLDYGFGIKLEVKFRVPAPSDTVNTATNPIQFYFSGDDDLWMYITDESGNSHLMLDMGGNHKMSTGTVDFYSLTSTVNHVYQGNTQQDAPSSQSFDELGMPNFDYDQTYTMTVFYMERGLIESNCHMTFSMYPAGNQVNVEKLVDTTDINSTTNSTALQEAVAAADTFDFTASEATSQNGTYTALKNTEYMHNYYGNMKTNAQNGSFPLEDTENAAFLSKIKTNDYVIVNEADPNSGKNLKYSTTWSVSDPLDSNRNLSDQSGLSTTAMQLKNKKGNDYDYAQLDYVFVNTPDTGTVSVTKTMDSTKADDLSKGFNAKVEISLQGGASGTFAPYPLTYTASDLSGTFETDANGNLSSSALLKNGRTLTFEKLPSNAVVKVTELLSSDEAEDYAASYPNGSSVTVPVNDGTATIDVKNTPLEVTPAKVTISGTKLLDDKPYTGDMFKFVLEGIAPIGDEPDDGNTYIDTSNTTDYVYYVENGTFSFSELTLTEPGVYRYHVYEDPAILAEYDTAHGTTFATDFLCMNTDFLVTVTVVEENRELKVDSIVYAPYSPFADMISIGEGAEGPVPEREMTSNDFIPDPNNPITGIAFYNTMEKGNISIVKTNPQGQLVDGVVFEVYPVTTEFLTTKQFGQEKKTFNQLTDEEKYDEVKKLGHAPYGAITGPDGDFDHGVAEIHDLPIYESGFVQKVPATADGGTEGLKISLEETTPAYQQYILIESSVEDSGAVGEDDVAYSVNKTIYVFSFPINGQYDFTFENIVNTQLKNPSTSGSGMTMFKLIGCILAGLSVLSLGFYAVRMTRRPKRCAGKHYSE